MIASAKFLFAVASVAVGLVTMIRASIDPGTYEAVLPVGLANVLYGAWLIRRDFK